MTIRNQRGQTLIYLVSLLSLVFLVVGVSAPLLLISAYRSLALMSGGKAFYGAQSGVQEAMLDLYNNPRFSGKSFSLGEVEIETIVKPAWGSYYDFESIGRYQGKLRRITGVFRDRGSYIELVNWQETGAD